MEGRPGALPLLQFALTEVWKKRDVRRLTLQAYNGLGGDTGEKKGIEGALEHRADEIYRNLKPEDKDLCRRLFLRLVQPGEGTEDTKRRVSYRWSRGIQFQQVSNAVHDDEEKARKLSLESRLPEAIQVLEATQRRLEPGVEFESLRAHVAGELASYQAKEEKQLALDRDNKAVRALDEARLLKSGTPKEGVVANWESTFSEYRRVFRESGIDIDTLAPEKAAELLHAKTPEIREALAAVIDDWAWRAGPPGDARLRKIASEADPDPWRNAVRDAVARRDVQSLKKRASDPDALHQPTATLDLLGSELSKAQEFGAAIALLQQAERRHRQDFWINYSLGFAFTKTTPARFDEAVRYYTAAVALRPQSYGANIHLGFALTQTGQYEEAFGCYDFAIKLDPKIAMAYGNRAGAHLARNEFDKTIADFDTAIRLDPGNAPQYVFRGYAHAAKNQFAKAFADFDTSIRLNPKNFASHANRGEAYGAAKQFDKAIADFDVAIRLAPQVVQLYVDRANSHAGRRDYQKALADCDNAARLDPNFAPNCNLRAWIYATCPEKRYRDGKKAVESAKLACELTGWRDPLILDTFAAACAEAGDFDTAINWMKKALEVVATDDETNRRDFAARLELYQAKKPYRTQAETGTAGNLPKK